MRTGGHAGMRARGHAGTHGCRNAWARIIACLLSGHDCALPRIKISCLDPAIPAGVMKDACLALFSRSEGTCNRKTMGSGTEVAGSLNVIVCPQLPGHVGLLLFVCLFFLLLPIALVHGPETLFPRPSAQGIEPRPLAFGPRPCLGSLALPLASALALALGPQPS